MSLKITNVDGFEIGGTLNTSITEIYVHVCPDTFKQKIIKETDNVEVFNRTIVNTTTSRFTSATIDMSKDIYSQYQLVCSMTETNKNLQQLELEEDLKAKLLEVHEDWIIEVITELEAEPEA